MSADAKIPFERGLDVARELLTLLAGTFVRASVAGSLRRGKPEVGDIELVLAPAFDGTLNLFEQRCEHLLASHFEKRLNRNKQVMAWGKPGEWSRYKAVTYHGLPVDLFVVLPDRRWGPTLLIRTGPGSANEVLVTTVGLKNRLGDVGVLPKGMKFDQGMVWRDGVALDTPEEEDVFAACALPWMPPGARSVETYQDWSDPDWEGAYRVSYIDNYWRHKRGSGIPRDAIDRDGEPLWLEEQRTCAAPMEQARPVEQMGLFG